jgi:hypothetical protein
MADLSRDDVEGQRIAAIYRGDWKSVDDVDVARCYVELESGTMFELISYDDDRPAVPIPRIVGSVGALTQFERPTNVIRLAGRSSRASCVLNAVRR